MEAAYTLENDVVDHGNFLEILLLLGKYDSILQNHIKECIHKSKMNHSLKPAGKVGRGNFVSMLSKTTINHILDVIANLVKNAIAKEINISKMFSIQIDTTQDITSKDQCSVITRYVYNDTIYERLLSMVQCQDSTGKGFKELVEKTLDSCNISIKKCVGTSTDGAANMHGQYNGFTAWLSSESPLLMHVWCYSHVLNLVMIDATSSTIPSESLFGLFNKTAAFIRDSYNRMDIWVSSLPSNDNRRLNLIGQTRWWAKDTALTKIFGPTGNVEKSLYLVLITTLEKIENDTRSKPDTRVNAKSFREGFLKYETVLTAFIFRPIFDITTHLSNYLQTSGLDILKAFNMVQVTIKKLKTLRNKFNDMKKTADDFIKWANQQLEKEDLESQIENSLPQKRLRKKKRMPGENAVDEVISDPDEAFRINIFNVIIDTAVSTLERRFEEFNNEIYADLAWLDPRSFNEIKVNGLQAPALEKLCEKLISFEPDMDAENLRNELINLAAQWNVLKTTHLEDYTINFEDDDISTSNSECGVAFKRESKEKHVSRKNCAICCYRLLNRYNLLTGTFPLIGLAYKYMLTLSFTQVACERSFSILKFIKNRLRSTMAQERLDAFMLMASEKDIVQNIALEMIIDGMVQKSSVFQKLLMY